MITIKKENTLDLKEFFKKFIVFSDQENSLTRGEVNLLTEVYLTYPEDFGAEAKKRVQEENDFGASYTSQTLTNLVNKGFVIKDKGVVSIKDDNVKKLIAHLKSRVHTDISLTLSFKVAHEEGNDQRDS